MILFLKRKTVANLLTFKGIKNQQMQLELSSEHDGHTLTVSQSQNTLFQSNFNTTPFSEVAWTFIKKLLTRLHPKNYFGLMWSLLYNYWIENSTVCICPTYYIPEHTIHATWKMFWYMGHPMSNHIVHVNHILCYSYPT